MTKLANQLATLKRPRMLVGAARRGLAFYRRERDLPRLIGSGPNLREKLLDREQEMEATRTDGRAGYSAALHIAILTALLAEAQMA